MVIRAQGLFLIVTFICTALSLSISPYARAQPVPLGPSFPLTSEDGAETGVIPIGDEFQVNTDTDGSQRHPSVATLAGGSLVVVWRSGPASPSDPTEHSIQGQLLATDGTALGEEFQVNSSSARMAGDPKPPALAALAGGGFVVVWDSYDGTHHIHAQRFAADGSPVGEEFQIGTLTVATHPSVSGLADGGFVVVWNRWRGSGSVDNSLQGQRYAADGTALGEELQVQTDPAREPGQHAVSSLIDGGFVVVWQNWGANAVDLSGPGIQGRRYSAEGTATGAVFQVNTYTASVQRNPAVAALADGGFVAVWETYECTYPPLDCASWSLQGQRFAADGTRIGWELQVATYSGFSQQNASVSPLADGGFVVVWRSGDLGIRGQRFAADGSTLGREFQVNTAASALVGSHSSVSPTTEGGFVGVWGSWDPSSSTFFEIHGQRFAAPDPGVPRFAWVSHDGQCLDAGSADPADDTPVFLRPCSGAESQRWRLRLSSAAQRIIGPGGKCLIPGITTTSGEIGAVIGECGGPADLWQLATHGPSSPSTLILAGTDLCLDTEGASTGSTQARLLDCHGGDDQIWRPAPEVCSRDSRGLCLNRNRFRVDVDWRDYQGTAGSGRAVPMGSDDSGLLWFFSVDNWEMLIKVLDGCGLNDRYWVFAAATTDVEYTLRVTDTEVGAIREYSNSLGAASPAITDTDAFATCSASSTTASIATPMAAARVKRSLFGVDEPSPVAAESKVLSSNLIDLYLHDNRFLVEADWRDPEGNTGVGHKIPFAARDSGILRFFGRGNWEMLIKVLDGCTVNGRYWVFVAATTDVEYRLRISDLETGETREYFNPLGTASPAITDTLAFDSCP